MLRHKRRHTNTQIHVEPVLDLFRCALHDAVTLLQRRRLVRARAALRSGRRGRRRVLRRRERRDLNLLLSSGLHDAVDVDSGYVYSIWRDRADGNDVLSLWSKCLDEVCVGRREMDSYLDDGESSVLSHDRIEVVLRISSN